MPHPIIRAVSFLFALLVPLTAQAQGFPNPAPTEKTKPIPGAGTEFFRALLHLRGIKPVKANDINRIDFRETIVVIVGHPHQRGIVSGNWIGRQQAEWCIAGVRQHGGALLVASRELFSFEFGNCTLHIEPAEVTCANAEHIHHRSYHDCPLVVPVAPRAFANAHAEIWQLFNGTGALPELTQIAAGNPGWLTITRPDGLPATLVPLALFPHDCTANDRVLSRDKYFAAGGEWQGDGLSSRCVAFSSNYTFSNALLFDPSIQNGDLCKRTIEYVAGGGPLERRHCLFIENGQVVDHFDDLARQYAQSHPLPVPSTNLGNHQQKLVDWANQRIADLEANDTLNQMTGHGGAFKFIIVALSIALAILGIFFMLRRLFRAGKPSNLPPPPHVAAAATGPPGVFERRQRELLRRRNLFEPVRELVRAFFVSAGVKGGGFVAGTSGIRELPRLWISEEVRRPKSLRLALKDFWKLAYGPPQVMGVSQWQEMEPYFARVRQAHADGKWGFEFDTSHAARSETFPG